jgi:hypothetical protein
MRAAGAVATSIASSGALPGALALRIALSALTVTLSLARTAALTNAAALAISAEPCRFALRNDLAGVHGYIASAFAMGFGFEIRLTLRRRRRDAHLDSLSQDAVDAHAEGIARRLRSGAGLVIVRS